jgi:hypothetical protein
MLSQQQPPNTAHPPSPSAKTEVRRPMEYRFVSGLDTGYSKAIRARALQHHMRERRLRAERRTGKKDKPVDEDDLAKSPTTFEPPAALGEDHSIPTQDARLKPPA